MYILVTCTIISTIILFLVCNKKVEGNQSIYNEVLSPVVEKIGGNDLIANEVLKYIGNNTTKVEKNKDEKIKSSFYNGNNDKILIKDTEDLKDCSRVIHISHECIHSIQDKKIIKLHFILSNIQVLYFLGIFIYFFYNKNMELRFNLLLVQLAIFIVTFFVKIVLESDATYRGLYLGIDYLSNKVGENSIKEFKKEVEEKLCKVVPISYFGLYMQGAMLLIIAQLGGIFI